MTDDLISRQQAINALRAMQTYKMFAGDDLLLIDQEGAQTVLMMLPSAQPEPEAVFEWKREFKEYIESLDITRDDWKGIIEYIDELPSAQPKTGHWILDRSGKYCCSKCMEPCATYIMMRPRDKFCKMCGAKMEDERKE